MTSNILIIFDTLIANLLQITALLLRLTHSIIKKIFNPKPGNTILVIKLLGAGNFVALADTLSDLNITILTVGANKAALKKFIPNAEVITLNQKTPFLLFYSIIRQLIPLFFRKFSTIINLEAESNFARFSASIPYAQKITGISNKNKSIFDYLFYDYHLVSPEALHRSRIFRILNSGQVKENIIKASSFNSSNDIASEFIKSADVKRVFLAPTCSTTDNNRRLSSDFWVQFVEILAIRNIDIYAGFASEEDPQFEIFHHLKLNGKLKILMGSYDELVENISQSDLTITIDSQALHIAQQLSKPVICFYGPTSPHGVRLDNKTFVISKHLECSPCTHKYYTPPCRGNNYCMNYTASSIESIINILPNHKNT